MAAYGALEARRWAEQAAEAGCPAVMLLPPNAYRADVETVVAHYREVAKAGLPIVAYNNPIDTKVDLTPALLARLHHEGLIVAVKEFTGDVRRAYELAELAPGLDLIVGADDVVFADVVGTRLGMCGLEYFAHPWEFGARKTKELMLTGDSIDIDEAHRLGMVSKVFPRAELEESTLEFARRIAKLPTMTALMIKESVNETQDNQGFYNSLNACFTLHQLNHAHWAEVHEDGWPAAKPEDGIPSWKEAPPIVPAEKTTVRAVEPA